MLESFVNLKLKKYKALNPRDKVMIFLKSGLPLSQESMGQTLSGFETNNDECNSKLENMRHNKRK